MEDDALPHIGDSNSRAAGREPLSAETAGGGFAGREGRKIGDIIVVWVVRLLGSCALHCAVGSKIVYVDSGVIGSQQKGLRT